MANELDDNFESNGPLSFKAPTGISFAPPPAAPVPEKSLPTWMDFVKPSMKTQAFGGTQESLYYQTPPEEEARAKRLYGAWRSKYGAEQGAPPAPPVSGQPSATPPPTGLTFPEYTKQTSAPDIGAYRQALRGLTSGEPTAADMELAGRLRASAATSAATSAPPVDEQMLVNGVRFTPAGRAGTTQVGGRSIMGDYVDTVRSGLLAQDATAKAQQLGNTPEGRAYAEMARAHDEAYQSAKQAFASKYGSNANNIFQQASQQLRSRGITPEQLMSGAADRMTENVVFPQYGEVLPGMGVATNAQGQIVRTVMGSPSGAPQTVYTPTAQGIQATSLAPSQTLMDPGLAAYLGASQITPEAARLSAEGLPVMQSALTKRERAQLQQQQIARADLTKAREAARSQYGLDLSPQPTGPGMPLDKALALGSDLLKSNSELEAKRGQTTDPAELARLSAMITNNNAQISRLQHKGVNVYRQNPETKDWELNTGGTAPKGLAATKEQVTPKAAALSPAKLEKDREDWKSEYGKAQAAAREASKEGGDVPADIMSTLRDLVKRSAKLGINVKPDGNWSIPAELKKAKPGGEVADDETAKAFLDAFDGDIGKASAALEAYGWKSK